MPSLFSSANTSSKKSSDDNKRLLSEAQNNDVTAELLYKYGYAGEFSVRVIPDMSKKSLGDVSEKNEKKSSSCSVKQQLPLPQNEPALNTADLIYKYGFGSSLAPIIVAPKDKSKTQEPSNGKTVAPKSNHI